MSANSSKWAGAVISLIVIGLAVLTLRHALASINIHNIANAMSQISVLQKLLCGALTVLSFIVLGLYDALAARFLIGPARLSAARAWFSGVTANALGNTLGFHAVTSTAVRLRLLTRSGLSKSEVLQLSALSWTAVAFGFAFTYALASIASPGVSLYHKAAGVALLATLGTGIFTLGAGRHFSLAGARLSLPPAKLAIYQSILGTVEMVAAMCGLFVLMPVGAFASLPGFCLIYIAGVILGIVSHTPGGLGVFEAMMLAASVEGHRAGVVAALLLYRLIYNIGPFLGAVAVLIVEEIRSSVNLTEGIAE